MDLYPLSLVVSFALEILVYESGKAFKFVFTFNFLSYFLYGNMFYLTDKQDCAIRKEWKIVA